MAKRKKSHLTPQGMVDDRFDIHEVLDRTSIIERNFDDFIVDAPVLTSRPKLLKHALRVSAALGDFYQAVGRERWKR